jgi:hypothetical protein
MSSFHGQSTSMASHGYGFCFLFLFLFFKCSIWGYNLKKKKKKNIKVIIWTRLEYLALFKHFFFFQIQATYSFLICLAIIIFFLSQNFLFHPQKWQSTKGSMLHKRPTYFINKKCIIEPTSQPSIMFCVVVV